MLLVLVESKTKQHKVKQDIQNINKLKIIMKSPSKSYYIQESQALIHDGHDRPP